MFPFVELVCTRAARHCTRALLVLALGFSLSGLTAPPAVAAPSAHTGFNSVSAAPSILREAARHAGKSYVYGAVGPSHFDCSGYTMYVFSKFGIRLPHNSGAQRAVTMRIPASGRRPGDLVFTHSRSGRVTHVGIYAGGDTMWHSPHTGSSVRHSPLFSRRVSYGRVG